MYVTIAQISKIYPDLSNDPQDPNNPQIENKVRDKCTNQEVLKSSWLKDICSTIVLNKGFSVVKCEEKNDKRN